MDRVCRPYKHTLELMGQVMHNFVVGTNPYENSHGDYYTKVTQYGTTQTRRQADEVQNEENLPGLRGH
jgi:hypothetical protein